MVPPPFGDGKYLCSCGYLRIDWPSMVPPPFGDGKSYFGLYSDADILDSADLVNNLSSMRGKLTAG